MKSRMYSVYDSKALVYNSPFLAPTHQAAMRMISDVVADPNTSLGRHPNDYVLYCIAEFDDGNGIVSAIDPREHVVDCAALVPIEQTRLFQDPPQLREVK